MDEGREGGGVVLLIKAMSENTREMRERYFYSQDKCSFMQAFKVSFCAISPLSSVP